MSYIFTGLLSWDSAPNALPEDNSEMVYRKIDHATIEVGLMFPSQVEDQIAKPNQTTEELITKSKIDNGIWVYYECWGGNVEIVALAKVVDSKADMRTYRSYDDVNYSDLHSIFSNYGITIEENGHFEPFVRHYWGEHGH